MNKRECTSRAIIPIEKDGRKYILSMKREKKRNGKKEVYFSLPGGHLEDRESFEEAAIREVEEEFGIKIAIKELLCHIYVEELKRDEKFFICNYISGEIRKGNGEEWTSDSEIYGTYEIVKMDVSKLDTYEILPEEVKNMLIKKYQNQKK